MQVIGKWYVGYGAFLCLCGVVGYLSNPEAAKTALISGTVFGGLMAFWGYLMLRQWPAAWWAAAITTVMLTGVFTWRSTVGWQQTLAGEPKLFAAILISLMLAASLLSLAVLCLAKFKSRH